MSQGGSLMLLADTLAAQSRDSIKRSNDLRKAIGAARYKANKLPAGEIRQWVLSQVDIHGEQMQGWKELGAKLRKHAKLLRAQSLLLFKKAMLDQWHQWIVSPKPLLMSDTVQTVSFAHNTRVRSVHPRMPSAKVDNNWVQHKGMSLEVSAISGQELPVGLNLESFNISRNRKLFAHIEVESDSANAPGTVPLNQLHSWRLIVSAIDGAPLQEVDVEFAGHMPGHVHGLPTQPKIDEELAPGVFRISGVKFQMRGWWVIDLKINTEAFTDYVRFNIVL
ncbi:MAG: FixH family protein [Spongiibacteraceae bacterium]|nr:FixH family protein [Spongiibacteraceae bacterium]